MLGMKDGDAAFSVNEQIKKVLIAVGFAAAIPLILLAVTGVDLFQGCVTYTENNVPDGSEVGDCRIIPPNANFLQKVFIEIQENLPLGILIFLLAMGTAIMVGPGKSIIKYQLG